MRTANDPSSSVYRASHVKSAQQAIIISIKAGIERFLAVSTLGLSLLAIQLYLPHISVFGIHGFKTTKAATKSDSERSPERGYSMRRGITQCEAGAGIFQWI